jgi:hypothetical protein
MARRDPAAGVRLLTRNGYDWTARYPLIRQAVDRLRVRSCDWAIGRIYEERGGSRQYALVLVIVRDGRQGALSGHEGPRADARRAVSRAAPRPDSRTGSSRNKLEHIHVAVQRV